MYSLRRPELVILARHGQARINALMQGQAFCPTPEIAAQVRKLPNHLMPLTQRGYGQAQNLGKELSERFGSFDAVVHSQFIRARQTAYIARRQWPFQPPVWEEFRFGERENGYPYSLTADQAHAQWPWLQEYWKRTGWFLAQPPGGESCMQVLQRAIAAWDNLCHTYDRQRVLIVSHGRLIQTLEAYLAGMPLHTQKAPNHHPRNAGYLVCTWDSFGRINISR